MNTPHSLFAPTLYGTPGSRWQAAGDREKAGPAYGCALISRLPLANAQVFRIPAVPLALPLWVPGAGIVVVREEPRVAVVARVDIGAAGVTVVATHLPFVPGWKRRQLRRLVKQIRTRPDPLLLMGDLNLGAGTAARLTGYQQLGRAATFPSARPRHQFDHILLRGGPRDLGCAIETSTPLLAVSDHRPLVVDVDPATFMSR